MTEVGDLAVVKSFREPDQELIKGLEELLDLVRRGEIANLVVAHSDYNHEFWTLTHFNNVVMGCGLVAALQKDTLALLEGD